jgi:hypothetical protein
VTVQERQHLAAVVVDAKEPWGTRPLALLEVGQQTPDERRAGRRLPGHGVLDPDHLVDEAGSST